MANSSATSRNAERQRAGRRHNWRGPAEHRRADHRTGPTADVLPIKPGAAAAKADDAAAIATTIAAPTIAPTAVAATAVATTTSATAKTLTVRVPLRLQKRGGRKVILTPAGGAAWAPREARVDSALLMAIARAHRWRRMLEVGVYASTTELGDAEKINQSYLCRVLRLTLLAPDIVEAILDGRQSHPLQLRDLMKPFPVEWKRQQAAILR
jgi:hypothetical protein